MPICLFVLAWEIAARSGILATAKLFPPFSSVLSETFALLKSGVMTQSLLGTLARVLAGLCLGAFSGIAAGIVLGWWAPVGRSLSPVISILYPIPALGWLPLLMVWIGMNELLPMAIIAIASFFPVCYNTATGVRNVDQGMIRAAHILGASDIRTLFGVVLPVAAPYIFAGLRLSSGMAWRTAIAAEMVAVPTGVGALLMKAESLVRVDIIMSCLVVLSVMCLLFESAFAFMERKVSGEWRSSVPH